MAAEGMTGLVMYYKTTGFNTVAHPAQLWVVRLEADGSALAAGFDPVNLLNQTEKWEAKDGIGCIEAPAMHRVRVAATATTTSAMSSVVVVSGSSTGTNTTGSSSGGVNSLRAGSSRRSDHGSTSTSHSSTTTTSNSTDSSNSSSGVVTDDSRFLLFYSGGNWEAGLGAGEVPYSMGVAACDTPLGPCTKLTTDERGPWFGPSYNDTVGPGSCEVFTTPPTPDSAEGEPWIVFHGWEQGKAGYDQGGKRMLRMYPFTAMPELPAVTV